MNFLRKIVSGKRNRLKEAKFDLDITYITRRVAGMSFPASGLEQCYRNNINDVSTLIKPQQGLFAFCGKERLLS
jgi:phosphatidylinositol-3,4,5-trisphosphate 3-phosphatase/dual-specificity protein phosphatase PTEN